MDSRLISPRFAVPATDTHPRLQFWHWFNTPYVSHVGHVQVSTNGTTWTDVSPAFHYSSGGWTRHTVDPSAYAGTTIQVAFHFQADGGASSNGWYIDEVTMVSDIFLTALDQMTNEPQLLTFHVAANVPGLNFGFHGPVPDGATIDTNTGQFSWTPSEQQGPGFYTFTVWATQNGNSLTPVASKSFNVTVLEANIKPTVDSLPIPSPVAQISNSDSSEFSWMPGEAHGPGEYAMNILAMDDGVPNGEQFALTSDPQPLWVIFRQCVVRPQRRGRDLRFTIWLRDA